MRTLYGEDPPAERFSDCAARVLLLMEPLWRRCLVLGIDVVLDFGFWSRAERDRMRTAIAGLGAEARLYRLNCSETLAWQRVAARNSSCDSSLYIAPNTFRILLNRFAALAADEGRIEIDATAPPRS
jgi:predicted kinase